MYGYGYGYYGFDWTYVLLIIGMLLHFPIIAKSEVHPVLPERRQQRESFVRQGLQMYM